MGITKRYEVETRVINFNKTDKNQKTLRHI